MKTYRIEVKTMLNPRGGGRALLVVSESMVNGGVRFSYREEIVREFESEERTALELAFVRSLEEDRRFRDRRHGFIVNVDELSVEPKNQTCCALVGCFAARELLKQMKC